MMAELTQEGPTQDEPVADLETLLDEHAYCHAPRSGDICVGKVLQVGSEGALVNVGFKREGLVSEDDLRQMQRAGMEQLQVGDEVPVLILRSAETDEYLSVSVYKARLAEDWLRAEEMLRSGELYSTEITGYNRGGLTVQFGRIRGFIPLSHVVGLPRRLREVDRKERLEEMVGQEVGLRVIEVDRRRRRLILSQRQAHRAWQKVRRRQLLEELVEGERRTGTVTSITDFGLFVDLGGADGLVHLSELSWGRVDDPRQVAKVGDEVTVVVLGVDRDRGRIALSLKQTQEDPWSSVDQRYQVGQLLEGRVTQVSSIGAFVELEPGVEGLLHVSELVGAPAVVPQDVLQADDTVLTKIIRIEPGRRRVGLSARRVGQDEWERWAVEKAAAEEALAADDTGETAMVEPLADVDAAEAEELELVVAEESATPPAEDVGPVDTVEELEPVTAEASAPAPPDDVAPVDVAEEPGPVMVKESATPPADDAEPTDVAKEPEPVMAEPSPTVSAAGDDPETDEQQAHGVDE